jgi:hypothetical protein
LCNIEAFDGSWPGGCRIYNTVYPLQPISVLGVQQWIPNSPEINLEQCYGPDWRIPRPKGYKVLVCGWMPVENVKFGFMWLVLSALPCLLYLTLPLMWNRFLIAIGKRNVTHKYTTLPLHGR